MNILITILAVIGGIIALLLLVAAFTRKKYSVERSIVINKSSAEVFDYIKHIKNQDHYSKWVMTDPNMKKSFRGTDGTVGFVYAWNGNKQAGEGEQEIVRIEEGKRVDTEVRFIRPFAAVGQTPMILEPQSSNQTRVRWGMSSEMKYPMNIILVLFGLENALGKDLEISLNNLKNILEQQ
jgi:hypothetical protein